MMQKTRIVLSCLFISAILLVGILPQKNTPTLLTVIFTVDGIEFVDAHGSIVGPLALKRTVLSDCEVNGGTQVCLAKPKGTRTFACAYVAGYLVSAEGQTCNSLSVPIQGEVEETEGVKILVNRTALFGGSVAYSCEERHEPHSDGQPKSILVREPPRYLPPKRQSRLLV
jgi:hypothetical protein